MTRPLTLVPLAVIQLTAKLSTLERDLGAASFRLHLTAQARLGRLLCAGLALAPIVACHATLVHTARQEAVTLTATLPGPGRAANRFQVRLTAGARLGDDLRTRWTRARMTEQHTTVTAIGSQGTAANLTASVWNLPGMRHRIRFLATKAIIFARNRRLLVLLATLRTMPTQHQRFLRHILAGVRIIAVRLALVMHLLLGQTVVGPALDAGEVHKAIAMLA